MDIGHTNANRKLGCRMGILQEHFLDAVSKITVPSTSTIHYSCGGKFARRRAWLGCHNIQFFHGKSAN
jgi:hypothetical protein